MALLRNRLESLTLILTLAGLLLIGCGSLNPSKSGSRLVDHNVFTELLLKYVDKSGQVDYQGFQSERSKFNGYLNELMANPPDAESWPKNDQIAYWINAYNAFTIQLILDNYPVSSIKDIGAKIQIPFVNTPWDIKFIKINNEEYDLNNIEHNILRKNFDEPRIHFAIVCASYSCPVLRREAYTGLKLEEQLSEQARIFLSDETKNQIKENQVKVSKIFNWFKGDFTKNGTLIDFLNKYAPVQISEKAKISNMPYDWSLNEQKKTN